MKMVQLRLSRLNRVDFTKLLDFSKKVYFLRIRNNLFLAVAYFYTINQIFTDILFCFTYQVFSNEILKFNDGQIN